MKTVLIIFAATIIFLVILALIGYYFLRTAGKIKDELEEMHD